MSTNEAAQALEEAANYVLDMALNLERDPGSRVRVADLCDAVKEWKRAGQALHDATVAEARTA